MGDQETAGERLSVRGAIEAIQRAGSYGEPLRRRAEGMTWMAWGLAAGGLFLTAAFLGYVVQVDWESVWWVNFIWVPWVLVGTGLTYAAWRMAGVRLTRPAAVRIGLALAAALVVGLGTGMLGAAAVPGSELAMPLLAPGAAWVFLGATNLARASSVGRRVMLALGVGLVVAGVAVAILVQGLGDEGWNVTLPVAIALNGGGPFVAGLWQVARG